MTEDEKIIRKFENEVLDQCYKKYELLKYSDEIAIPYLLKQVGDFQRQVDDLKKHGWTDYQIQLLANNILHATSHCVRWVQNTEGELSGTIENHEAAGIKAQELIGWALSYNKLVQEFTAWSRGLKRVKLEYQGKKIYFEDQLNLDYGWFLANQWLYSMQLDITYASFPHQLFETTFQEWYKNIQNITPPIAAHIDWRLALKSKAFEEFVQVLRRQVLPELSEDFDLGGYQLKDFLVFHATLAINFYFICWIEERCDKHYGENPNPFGSNPLDFPLPTFYKFASEITGLKKVIVENIVGDLIFDYKHPTAALVFQPFVLSKKGTLFIMPNIYPYIDTHRMLAGALNKGKKKKIYDHLINQVEEKWLDKVENLIKSKTNWRCFKNKVFKHGAKTIRPDFVLIDDFSRLILVVDYKHFLSPIGPTEVSYRYREVTKGFQQIERYLQMLPGTILSHEVSCISEYQFCGMLLSPLPLVVPIPKGYPIYLFDYTSLNTFFQDSIEQLSIASLVNTLNNGRLVFNLPLDSYTDEVILVEDWQVIRSGIDSSKCSFI